MSVQVRPPPRKNMSHLIVVDLITEIFWCEGFRATEDGRVIYVPPIDQAEVARIWGEGYTMSRDGSVS